MTHAIPQGPVPPLPGLEKEEPELRNEDDIPRDDRPQATQEPGDEAGRPRDVERE